MRRLLVALRRRAASGDLEALAELRDLEVAVKAEVGLAVRAANREAGYSFAEIALRLSMTRQAVQQRWGGE